MIRLSVTMLETLRYWKAREDSTIDDLVADLTYAKPPTVQMRAGQAFAKVMEDATLGLMANEVTRDGFTFDFSELDAEVALPDVRELKAEKTYQTPAGPVTLVGKVDGIAGLVVHDQKLTERFEVENYTESLQWRAYLDMFDARRFVYDVFLASYDRNDDHRVRVREFNSVPFEGYDGIHADVQAAVNELAEVVMRYGIAEKIAQARGR